MDSNSLNPTTSSSLLITDISKPNAWNSLINTLNASGIPGFGNGLPFTIDSYTFTRPTTSSDLYVNIYCNTCDAPYASKAHISISPNLCPPNCAFPPSGCCVTRE